MQYNNCYESILSWFMVSPVLFTLLNDEQNSEGLLFIRTASTKYM